MGCIVQSLYHQRYNLETGQEYHGLSERIILQPGHSSSAPQTKAYFPIATVRQGVVAKVIQRYATRLCYISPPWRVWCAWCPCGWCSLSDIFPWTQRIVLFSNDEAARIFRLRQTTRNDEQMLEE